jgi:hypothetical protein
VSRGILALSLLTEDWQSSGAMLPNCQATPSCPTVKQSAVGRTAVDGEGGEEEEGVRARGIGGRELGGGGG